MDPALRTIDVNGTSVQAQIDGQVIRALGIRYAHAERGSAPTPAALGDAQRCVASPQPRDTIVEGLLGFDPLDELPREEDCLRVSVTFPADLAPGERLPVMAWVHGGSYRSGAGDASNQDPAALVIEGRVVFVAVTYRLGAFGFLRSDAGQPANLGLLDVQEALRWIHTHIASFGGDPDQVTLFGQSSGADLIVKLLSLPETPTLVKRVILQSAPLGIADRPAGLDTGMAEIGEEVLAKIDAGDLEGGYALVGALGGHFGLAGAMPFSAEYGQAPLPPAPEARRAAVTNAAGLEVLIGHTAEETQFFLPMLRDQSRALRLPGIGKLLGRLVVRSTSKKVYERDNQRFAEDLAAGGAHVTRYVISANRGGKPIGAGHAVEIGLLFPLAQQAEWERTAGAELRRVWLQFVHTGSVPTVSNRTLTTIPIPQREPVTAPR